MNRKPSLFSCLMAVTEERLGCQLAWRRTTTPSPWLPVCANGTEAKAAFKALRQMREGSLVAFSAGRCLPPCTRSEITIQQKFFRSEAKQPTE